MAEKRRVCVTGAGGCVASWLVKLLLSKGFTVHGTVRDPSDPKNNHLWKLENTENLRLFKADILDSESLSVAIAGCEGVFHTACPILVDAPNVEEDIIRPSVEGTLNVLKACAKELRRVVYVSSGAAVGWNPSWPLDKLMDENCWSDKDYCLRQGFWYHWAKVVAEEKAAEYSKSTGLDVVVVNPNLVIGPLLQSSINFSSDLLIEFLKGKRISIMTSPAVYLVDVRDVADALLLVYEKPEAKGRYICSSYNIETKDFSEQLKKLYPKLSYPECNDDQPFHKYTSEKLIKLGWKPLPLGDSIRDSVEDLISKNIVVID